MTSNPYKKVYFDNLDGLRFLSFLAVFLYHSFHTDQESINTSLLYQFIKKDLFVNCNMGVNFFFVLSGFLITYILLIEKKVTGTVNIKNFLIRRTLRIWPLYYVCIVIGFFIFPYIKQKMGLMANESANLTYYLTFISNFDLINTRPDSSILGVLWSVSLEEQFYVVWPILFAFVSLRMFPYALILILLVTWLFRSVNVSYPIYELHTLSCIGDMIIGAFGAYLMQIDKYQAKVVHMKRGYIILLYVLFVAVFIFRRHFFEVDGFRVIERSFVAIIFLLIILEQNYSLHSLFKISRLKNFSYLGKISYGLYCLHPIGILVSIYLTKWMHLEKYLWQIILIQFPLSLLITILLSRISYKYFESFFLQIKERYNTLKSR